MTKIKCNHIPRHVMYGFELSEKQRAEFDYLNDIESHEFVQYKGQIYDTGEFLALDRHRNQCYSDEIFADFDGYHADSYFSGVLIKYVEDGQVIMATYIS